MIELTYKYRPRVRSCLVWSIEPGSERLEPFFSGFRENVAEAVRERGRSTLQLTEDPLDAIPISMPFRMKSEASSGKRSLEVLGAIDEKHGRFDGVFLTEFSEEHLCR